MASENPDDRDGGDREAAGRDAADRESTTATTTGPGLAALAVYGIVFGVGVILLFDTVHHLTVLYDGYVPAPGELRIRVFFTAGIGSACVLAGLSVATH